MKTENELNMLKAEAPNKKPTELTDEELSAVVGGSDYSIRKDEYENIILGVTPEEHNVMLNNAPAGEMKVKCHYCNLFVPISSIEEHEARCAEKQMQD